MRSPEGVRSSPDLTASDWAREQSKEPESVWFKSITAAAASAGKPTPGQGAPGPPHRYLDLGQDHNRLSRAFTSRVVETLSRRAAIYLG